MTTSSDDILTGLLAECSDLILTGASIETCLDRYPEHATTLGPMLSTLVQVRELRPVPARTAAAATQARAQFMAAAVRLADERNHSPIPMGARLAVWWRAFTAIFARPASPWGLPRSMPAGLLAAMVIVILFGALVTGGVTVSARALPGDFLYPVKIASEHVQLLITSDPLDRSNLQQRFVGRRVDEARAVVQLGRRVASLPLDGTIDALDNNMWTVSGLLLTLAPDARIIGVPALGAKVHGVMRAPGDGRLLLVYAEVEAPNLPQQSMTQTLVQPTATPTSAHSDRQPASRPRRPPRRQRAESTRGTAHPADAGRTRRLGHHDAHRHGHPHTSGHGCSLAQTHWHACSHPSSHSPNSH